MSWRREVLAILRKEVRSELRSKSGLIASSLFSIVAVVAIAFATISLKVTPPAAAGLFWITLLFSSMIALPRAFTLEEELGTGDLLRLMARPHAVFWGKMLFNLALVLLSAAVLAVLFLLLVEVRVVHWGLFAASLVGSAMALAGGVTLSGAIVAQAANRGTLAGAIALPLLLPVTIFGVAGLTAAFGETASLAGRIAATGLVGYGVVSIAIGPYLFAAVWKS